MMFRRLTSIVTLAFAATTTYAAVRPVDSRSVAEISAAVGAPVSVSYNRATGTVSFLRLTGAPASADLAPVSGSLDERARSFFATQAALFGIRDQRAELSLISQDRDASGFTHLRYRQTYRGVPVFAAELRAHFDASSKLQSVNGAFVPGIDLNPTPRTTALAAMESSVAHIRGLRLNAVPAGLTATVPKLEIYRMGLDQGVAGTAHLVWSTVVSNGGSVRDFVYVDAQTGKVRDVLPGVMDTLDRRAFPGFDGNADTIPDAWPASPDWLEGDPIPSDEQERDNMLISTEDVYTRFFNAFGRDAYDNAGHVMDQAYQRNYSCPNASWNGSLISFCPGFTTHDVTAHEWGHAYTEYTHGLIYRWQSGALNESYSDIWGESFDQNTQLTGMPDPDGPNTARTANACSTFQSSPVLTVNSPPGIADDYTVGTAAFGPWLGSPITADFVQVVDTDATPVVPPAVQDPSDGCDPLTNGPYEGKTAFVNRGNCSFYVKTLHAQAAGAGAVVIGNIAASPTPGTAPLMGCGTPVPDPLCVNGSYSISSFSLNFANAELIRANLAAPINGTIQFAVDPADDDSLRWMMGEGVGGSGPLRDMWNPSCFGDPGKVSDVEYFCGTGDNGGVHFNSGVPNHAFALLVDGGTYNGHTVTGIGFVKAAHLYYRAQTVYQSSASDFGDHADALEASCEDLEDGGTTQLADPWGGPAQTLVPADCVEVHDAMLAVEMRTEPTQCNFQPMLTPDPPAPCLTGFDYTSYVFDWEGGAAGWTASRRSVANVATFDNRDWSIVSGLPGGRPGSAFLAPDPDAGNCADDLEAGVLVLESPTLVMPLGSLVPRISFEHYVSTETTYDGGNLKISVNGGAYTVVPPSAYSFNDQVGLLGASDDPLTGEQAWHGADGGTIEGSWGRTVGNLAGIVAPGQTFKLRYEMGTDGCGGSPFGWFVDDVKLYSCQSAEALFLDGFEIGNSNRWNP